MNARAGESGMTLVEALVALFIMALASSMIVLTMPPRPAPVEVAIYKFADLAETARNAALVKGTWTGVMGGEERYQVVTFQDGAWVPASARPVRIEGELRLNEERPPNDPSPLLQFGPTGTAQEENVILSIGINERSLAVSRDGAIVLGEVR